MNKDDSLHRLLQRAWRPEGAVRPQETCLDAETVAAWTDGSLNPAERAAAETHAADCDRCLAVLAAIAKTAPPPSSMARPAWLSVRWLVPLTTAAVAITAWAIVQEPLRPAPPAAPSAAVDGLKPADAAATPERDVRAEALADAPQKKPEAPPAPKTFAGGSEPRRAAEPPAKAVPTPAPQAPGVAQPPADPTAAAPSPLARAETRQERGQSAARVIVSPDQDARWRLVGSTVERSTDGGRSWQAQPTGTALELMAGSAPAPTVCWIVGRSGLVLLSTDGETWRRLPSPDASTDLVGVRARDGVSATVTTGGGRTYRTGDAGKTWVLQENPPAPF